MTYTLRLDYEELRVLSEALDQFTDPTNQIDDENDPLFAKYARDTEVAANVLDRVTGMIVDILS